MYKKILIPTDGSALSLAAARKGIEFAQTIGASVVAFYAAPHYLIPVYDGGFSAVYVYPTLAEYKKSMHLASEQYFGPLREAAEIAGVEFTSLMQFNDASAQAITKAAQSKQCDLIFMGSHGRTGLSRMFIGSVANKVMAGSTIPVLIHRAAKQELAQAEKYLKQAQKTPAKTKSTSVRHRTARPAA
jgi:nucleotide-binding universal stress UspA family protein